MKIPDCLPVLRRLCSISCRGLLILSRSVATVAFYIFVAVLFAVVLGIVIAGERDPRTSITIVPQSWAHVESINLGPLHDVMESYAIADDIPGAIKLIKTTVVESDRLTAIVDLMQQVRFHQPDPLVQPAYDSKQKIKPITPGTMTVDEILNAQQASDEKVKAYLAIKNKETVSRLQPIKDYLDTFGPSEERVKAYAAFATIYLQLDDKPKAAHTYDQLASDLTVVQATRWPQWIRQIIEWFRPLAHERIGVFVCGIMASLAFLFRPTALIRSKALAFWWYSKSTSPYIKRALSEDQPKSNSRAE